MVSSKNSRSEALGQRVGYKQGEGRGWMRSGGSTFPVGWNSLWSCLARILPLHLSLLPSAVYGPSFELSCREKTCQKTCLKAQGSEELKIGNVFGEKRIMKVMRLNCLPSIWLLIP